MYEGARQAPARDGTRHDHQPCKRAQFELTRFTCIYIHIYRPTCKSVIIYIHI